MNVLGVFLVSVIVTCVWAGVHTLGDPTFAAAWNVWLGVTQFVFAGTLIFIGYARAVINTCKQQIDIAAEMYDDFRMLVEASEEAAVSNSLTELRFVLQKLKDKAEHRASLS